MTENTMSFQSITAIAEAEAQAASLRASGEEEGRELLSRTHQEGKDLLARVEDQAKEERKHLMRQAEQAGRQQAEDIAEDAKANAMTLRHSAALRRQEAIAIITERIVKG